MKFFELPDVGEGLTEAEVVRWHVGVGDAVSVNDVICEIETAKSLVELPSPYAGTVADLLVREGETVVVGTALLAVGDAMPGESPSSPSEGVLVGYGPASDAGVSRSVGARRRRRAQLKPSDTPRFRRPLAKPPVRWLARELGVVLDAVPATGAAGEITRADVVLAGARPPASTSQVVDPRRAPVRGVRKATAAAMSASAFSAPHVTVWKEIDATRTMELVRRLKQSDDYRDVRVSPLLLMACAVLRAAARTPELNASWVEEADGAVIVRHDSVNLGIAAATPRGLIVPNLEAAEQLSMHELAVALQDLIAAARSGRTTPAAQRGGTMTITNIGVFGVDGGTPILNLGESAIIAFGTIAMKPWVVDGEVRPREVMTIAGSFDHRVADGDAMSRFVADVAAVLEEPALLVA